jgi:hypothetical protein
MVSILLLIFCRRSSLHPMKAPASGWRLGPENATAAQTGQEE